MIPAIQARDLYTKALIAVYKERKRPSSFLRSFFRTEERSTKYLSIAVRRGTELIAVDVELGASGNRNSASKNTEKIFKPPFYKEWFDATDLDLYDVIMGAGMVDEVQIAEFVRALSEEAGMLQDKIERAYEKQCAEVFETGIVTLNKGININFGRKAGSLIDNSVSAPWTNDANDPNISLAAAGKFIVEEGKSGGAVFNVICGGTTWSDYLNNAKVKSRADVRRYDIMVVPMPQRNSVGASLLGEVAIDNYKYIFWGYPDIYETIVNGVKTRTPYMKANKVVVLPEIPSDFVLGFAAVPQLMAIGVDPRGAYKVTEFRDEENAVHKIIVRSRGVAVPVSIDQIVTITTKPAV